MGEANKRGTFLERQKLAIERNAREAEEAARLELRGDQQRIQNHD